MNINELRHKHTVLIVDHALRVYGVGMISIHDRNHWIEYLVSGGDLRSMLKSIRNIVIDSATTVTQSKTEARANCIYLDLQAALRHERIMKLS